MKEYKCNYCQDRGFIGIGPGIRGITKCPYCYYQQKPLQYSSIELVMEGYDDKYHEYIKEGGNMDFASWLLKYHDIIEKI